MREGFTDRVDRAAISPDQIRACRAITTNRAELRKTTRIGLAIVVRHSGLVPPVRAGHGDCRGAGSSVRDGRCSEVVRRGEAKRAAHPGSITATAAGFVWVELAFDYRVLGTVAGRLPPIPGDR
jgi:hypothetical protein